MWVWQRTCRGVGFHSPLCRDGIPNSSFSGLVGLCLYPFSCLAFVAPSFLLFCFVCWRGIGPSTAILQSSYLCDKARPYQGFPPQGFLNLIGYTKICNFYTEANIKLQLNFPFLEKHLPEHMHTTPHTRQGSHPSPSSGSLFCLLASQGWSFLFHFCPWHGVPQSFHAFLSLAAFCSGSYLWLFRQPHPPTSQCL